MPTIEKPRFASPTAPLHFVVEGVGDVIERYYEKGFRKLLSELSQTRQVRVTLADSSSFWRNRRDGRLIEKMEGIIRSVTGWGAEYVDKSDPLGLAAYQSLKPDVVIIATPDSTHVGLAAEWLRRSPRPEQIFIEKPLTDSVRSAWKLLGMVTPYDDGILAFDHYRARLLPSRTQLAFLLGFLGKGPWRLRFYFLEDHSGADPKYAFIGRDGAIENEQRVLTLNNGLVLDGMPHLIAVLATFGRVETLRPTRIWAGQYTGVDGKLDKRTEIDRETFAEVQFVCANYAGERIDGVAYVGKGLRGVRSLGTDYDRDVKLLEIESEDPGHAGNKVRFDLRSTAAGSRAYFIAKDGRVEFEFALNDVPYQTFLQKVANGTYREDNLALPLEVGMSILVALEGIRHAIPDKAQIPTYPSGVTGQREAPYLEEVRKHLGEPLWGISA